MLESNIVVIIYPGLRIDNRIMHKDVMYIDDGEDTPVVKGRKKLRDFGLKDIT